MRANTTTLDHRYKSYMNYQELFAEVLTPKSVQPVGLQIPNIWLWDIIDE
jgi:hypothetical protein